MPSWINNPRAQSALVWCLCLMPLAAAFYWGLTDQLGANPINTGLRYLGIWGLRFLVIGLALRPLRDLFGWSWAMRYRRRIGLFALFYVSLHVLVYVGIDQFFDMNALIADVIKRPYITFGMIGFLGLIPLGITSTRRLTRKLGPIRWRRLHSLIYVIVPLGGLHYFLLVKRDVTQPLIYIALIAMLLGLRIWLARTKAASPRRVRAPA
jgi:sulfoxide reductase heme-binding subunit YedZ